MRGVHVEITSYADGVPCWIDVAAPDVPAAAAFYTALFGWTAHVGPAETGGYTICHLGDHPVAGIGPAGEGQAPAWAWYAATADADATSRRVEAAGGKVIMGPLDVMDSGRMAMYTDTSGIPFAAWQKINFAGAQRVNEPGTFVWNELMTRDPAAATAFYRQVLGWDSRDSEFGAGMYTEFRTDGRTIAGLMPMTGDLWPAELPELWVIYLAVADCDATCERIVALGGSIVTAPMNTPVGRHAAVRDPFGAVFSVITMTAD